MSAAVPSPGVQRYQLVMRIMGLVYLVGAVLFLFAPKLVFWLINLPAVLPGVVGLPAAAEHFWVPLAASMMVMLVALAFAAASSPENRVYPWIHNLSKLASSLGYLYYFFRFNEDGWVFPYLLGFIVDFPIFLGMAWLTLRVAWAREPGEERKAPEKPNPAPVSSPAPPPPPVPDREPDPEPEPDVESRKDEPGENA